MKMSLFIVVLLGGLAVCGLLVVRHHRRTAAPAPARSEGFKPVDNWQQGIRLDPARGYRRDLDLLERLKREEERQKPQEGRN